MVRIDVDVLEPLQDALGVPMSWSRVPSSESMARSSVVTGILRLRSTLTEMTSWFEVSNSSQAPRFGISLA